jgi:hypothetical protein
MNFHKPAIDLASTAVGIGLGLVDYEGPAIDSAMKNQYAAEPFHNVSDLIRTGALAGGLLGASMTYGKIEEVSKNLFYEALPLFTESVTKAVAYYTSQSSSSTSTSTSSAKQPPQQPPHMAPNMPSQSYVQKKTPLVSYG